MQSSCRSLWIWKGKKGESFTSKQLNIGTNDWYQFNVQAKIFSLTYWNIVSFFWSGTIPDKRMRGRSITSTAYVPGSSSSSSSHLSSFYFSTKLRLHLSFQMSDVQLEMKTDTSINQSPEELKSVRRFYSLSLVYIKNIQWITMK